MADSVAEFYSSWAAQYDDYVSEALSWASPHFLYEAIKTYIYPGQHFLDLGIGTGLLSQKFHAHAGVVTTGIDVSTGMLAQCRNKNAANHLCQTDVNKTGLPFRDAAFDGVVSSGVLELLYPLSDVFAEMKRVTVPGGIIAFTYEQGSHRQAEALSTESSIPARTRRADYIHELLSRAGLNPVQHDTYTAYYKDPGKPILSGMEIWRVPKPGGSP